MPRSTINLSDLHLVPDGQSGAICALGTDPGDYVTQTNFQVMTWDKASKRKLRLGTIEVNRVLLGAALNQSVSWLDVTNGHNQDLREINSLMFEPGSTVPTAAFYAEVGDMHGLDLCYVDTDEVLDLPWGTAALHMLAQQGDAAFIIVGVSGLHPDASALERKKANQRLKVLAKMGFVQFANSQFCFLNMAVKLKPLPRRLAIAEA